MPACENRDRTVPTRARDALADAGARSPRSATAIPRQAQKDACPSR